MLVPAFIIRRSIVLGLMLASLVALADGVTRYELRQAIASTTLASAARGEQPADTSND